MIRLLASGLRLPYAMFRLVRRRQHSFLIALISAIIISASSILVDEQRGRRSTTTAAHAKFPSSLSGINPDPFVLASPLIVGVVCRDGVLLIAFHSIFSSEDGGRNESILLRKSYNNNGRKDEGDAVITSNNPAVQSSQHPYCDSDSGESSKIQSSSSSIFLQQKDLPRSYRGPFRIYNLDSSGTTAMVCAGWRTDCQYLAKCIRSIDKTERLVFGDGRDTSLSISNSGIKNDRSSLAAAAAVTATSSSPSLEYGSYLACQASLLLAELCTSEIRRPMCCVGLIASSSAGSSSGCNRGGLWFVDSTGAYRIRAHAVGAGSDHANEILRNKDWTKLDCKDAAISLLQSLFFVGNDDDDLGEQHFKNNDTNDNSIVDDEKIIIPKESLVEIATMGKIGQSVVGRKMKRIFASDLFCQI